MDRVHTSYDGKYNDNGPTIQVSDEMLDNNQNTQSSREKQTVNHDESSFEDEPELQKRRGRRRKSNEEEATTFDDPLSVDGLRHVEL